MATISEDKYGFAPESLFVKSNPCVDWVKAPEWASHAGHDTSGWGWFDRCPRIFNEVALCRGVLGMRDYPEGRHKIIHDVSLLESGGSELMVIARPAPAVGKTGMGIHSLLKRAARLQGQLEKAEQMVATLKLQLSEVDAHLRFQHKVARIIK